MEKKQYRKKGWKEKQVTEKNKRCPRKREGGSKGFMGSKGADDND